MNRLMRLATRERLLPPGGDLGYALHAILVASFAKLAPKPFQLLPAGVQGRDCRLLAYSLHPLDELRAHADAFADPDFLAPLALETAEAKTMPSTFKEGTRLGFRLRIRPVVRTGKPNPKANGCSGAEETGRARETDAYLAAVAMAGDANAYSRGKVYCDWLAGRFEAGGAEIEAASLEAFCRTRLMTRDRSNGGKTNRWTEGPDAMLSGTLGVSNSDAFAVTLARGIGRHRAFGFGMLLLSPPR